MHYDITLQISYRYEVPATGAHHMLRLLPLTIAGRQHRIEGRLTVSPEPDERRDFADFFNHPTTHVILRAPHEALNLTMRARVKVQEQAPQPQDGLPLEHLPQALARHWSLDARSPHHFLGESPRLAQDAAIAAYAKELHRPGISVLELASAISSRIHHDFTYDPKATSVDTTPAEAFVKRRGVCQDFSHVMIVALRSLGIPAGYVSGFLRTIPPPGQERLEGADAMHSWVRVWCGASTGWVELDPTNDMTAGTDHIVVGYGRDYADVAPVIGVLKTYGSHETEQAVDVVPVT